LAAGLGAAFAGVFFGLAFFVAFLPAALAFDAAVVPVTAFFTGARLLATVFLAAGAALALLARTFLGGGALALTAVAAFLGGGLEAVLVAETGLAFALVATGLVLLVLEAGLAAGLDLEAGLFSFDAVSAGLDLGANLTLPEGPLGRTKTPLSAPVLMAFASWVVWAAPISSLYLLSTNFLICGRETPMRASSVLTAMHSLIMSAQVGCEGAVLEAGAFFAAVDLVAFLADIAAIYDYEICLEDVLKDDRRMEEAAAHGSSGG